MVVPFTNRENARLLFVTQSDTAYVDDSHVMDLVIRRRSFRGRYIIEPMSDIRGGLDRVVWTSPAPYSAREIDLRDRAS